MRISIIITILLLITLAASSKGQSMFTDKVTIGLQHESLATALKKIEQQTPLRFYYRKADINTLNNLNLPVGERTVEETLHELLQNTFLSFKQLDGNILLGIDDQQTGYEVRGRLLDSKHLPVQFATVSLIKTGINKVVQTTQTDTGGYFKLSAQEKGAYLVKVSAAGMADLSVSVTLADNRVIQLPDVTLLISHNQLKEVTIEAQKPLYEQKLDRLVVNVQQSAITANGTVLEALQRSPGVDVDQQKNSISLNGKGGVLILINGKATYQPMDVIVRLLASMNASNVQQIELISNPPAEFDAAGNGGVINIVLIKNEKKGFNGNYGAEIGYGIKEKTGTNFDFNYGGKKFNLYGNFSYNRDHTAQTFTNERNVLTDTGLNNQLVTTHRDPVRSNLNSRVGIDFNTDSNTTIGASVSGFISTWDMTAHNTTFINNNNIRQSSISINNTELNQLKNLSGNVYLHKKMNKNSVLDVDLDYLYYNNTDPTGYFNTYYGPINNVTNEQNISVVKLTPVKIGVVKIDYTNILKPGIQWKSGAKSSFSALANNVNASTVQNNITSIDSALSNHYAYHENIGALYSQLSVEINKTTRFNAGLRYEYSNTTLKDYSNNSDIIRNSGNLFPTLFLGKTISKDNTLQFSFGRRITRPSFSDLAPFVSFLDPTTYFYGNPNLKASLSSVYKLDYVYKKYILTLQYNHASNTINTFQATLNTQTNQEILTSVNLKYSDSYSCILSLPVSFTNWWDMQFNFLGVEQRLQTSQLSNNIALSQAYFKINNTQAFKLSKTLSVNLSGVYQSKRLGGISEVSPRGTFDLGIQKKLNKNIIRFSYSDIFSTNTEKDFTNVPADNLDIMEIYHYEPRIFKLSISHKFGSDQKKRAERETGDEDIKSRIN